MSFKGTKNGRNRLKGDLSALMPSGNWAATHKGTAYGILTPRGKRVPSVTAAGSGFYYRAWWPARKVMAFAVEFAAKHEGCIPTRENIEEWVNRANYRDWYQKEYEEQEVLNVAAMEGRVSKRVVSAVDGGVVHEALHKAFTCQRELSADEVYDIIIPRWAKIEKMGKYTKLVLDAANVIEDIRIERLGCATYPGIRTKMADLQDFILTMEAESREAADAEQTALNVVFGTFRDIGLGYRTTLQREAIKGYEAANEEAFKLVTEGEIADILRAVIPDCSSKESVEAEAKRDLVSLEKAFDLIAAIEEMGAMPEPEEEGGKGGKTACPKCKAPASKLRARPVAGQDDKIAIVCTVCGHMEIIDKPEEAEGGEGEGEGGTSIENPNQPQGQPQQGGGQQGDVIRWEDQEMNAEDAEESEDAEGDEGSEGEESDESDENQSGEGEGSEGEGEEDDNAEGSEGEGDAEGTESASEGDDAEGEGEETAEGEDGAESDSEASGDDSTEGDADGETQDAPDYERAPETEAGFNQQQSSGTEGGGATSGESDVTLGDLLQNEVENGEGAGLMDYAEALGGKAEEMEERENAQLQQGEKRWKPADTSEDQVKVPRVDDRARRQGKDLTKSVKRECSYLLARLRQMVLGAQDTDIDEGIKKGRALSKRYLADTYISIKDCKRPERAFRRTDELDAPSTAAAVVVDESGSMGNILKEAGMMAAAIAQPMDALGCAVQVHGIRSAYYTNAQGGPDCHRDYSVIYDVIKDWEEPYRVAEPRFSKLQATGGTPLADGVEFALRGIQEREEDNRIIFVLTDGVPDRNHEPVIKHQLRVCKEQGIHVIGVGIGWGAEYVENLFPDSVYAENVADIPKMLVKKLNEVMQGQKRPARRSKVA